MEPPRLLNLDFVASRDCHICKQRLTSTGGWCVNSHIFCAFCCNCYPEMSCCVICNAKINKLEEFITELALDIAKSLVYSDSSSVVLSTSSSSCSSKRQELPPVINKCRRRRKFETAKPISDSSCSLSSTSCRRRGRKYKRSKQNLYNGLKDLDNSTSTAISNEFETLWIEQFFPFRSNTKAKLEEKDFPSAAYYIRNSFGDNFIVCNALGKESCICWWVYDLGRASSASAKQKEHSKSVVQLIIKNHVTNVQLCWKGPVHQLSVPACEITNNSLCLTIPTKSFGALSNYNLKNDCTEWLLGVILNDTRCDN